MFRLPKMVCSYESCEWLGSDRFELAYTTCYELLLDQSPRLCLNTPSTKCGIANSRKCSSAENNCRSLWPHRDKRKALLRLAQRLEQSDSCQLHDASAIIYILFVTPGVVPKTATFTTSCWSNLLTNHPPRYIPNQKPLIGWITLASLGEYHKCSSQDAIVHYKSSFAIMLGSVLLYSSQYQ